MHYNELPLHHFSKEIKKYIKKGKTNGLIFGNFGACNIGDEAILAGELTELKNIPTTEITVISRFPKKVMKIHSVSAISLFQPIRLLQKLLTTDYIIIGGGGLFCKNDSGVKGLLFQMYTTLLFMAIPLFLQKPVFLLGIGFYSNVHPFIARVTIPFVKRAKIVAVRDMASYDFLRKNKVAAKLYKDNSYLMNISEKISQNKTDEKQCIGLALNQPQELTDVPHLIEEIGRFLVTHADDAKFFIFALDYHPQYANDRLFAKKILAYAKKHTMIEYEYVNMTVSPQMIFSRFSQMDFMITSRLHASIFSYRLNIPFYAIAYDLKCVSFLKNIRHQYFYPSSVNATDITTALHSIRNKKNVQPNQVPAYQTSSFI